MIDVIQQIFIFLSQERKGEEHALSHCRWLWETIPAFCFHFFSGSTLALFYVHACWPSTCKNRLLGNIRDMDERLL